MGALNQFEREQTSERTSASVFARAQRGLWNGGHLLGYDLDKDRKGYLVFNEQEAALVNFLFDTYLENGSVVKTAKLANKRGYVSKGYVSRRDRQHLPKEFCYSAVLKILTNHAYIGVKEINKNNKAKRQDSLAQEKRYITCKAVWPSIVDKEKFNKVQVLLRNNLKHKNNGAKPTRHYYLFNGGVLVCHKCGSRMEGRNGHGKLGKIYYYYYCVNEECKFKVPQFELELTVQKIVKAVASTPLMIDKISDKLNEKLRGQLPDLKHERRIIADEIKELEAEAKRIMDSLMDVQKGKVFVEQRLSELDTRRQKQVNNLETINIEIASGSRQSLEKSDIKRMLDSFDEIFSTHVKPYQKRILLRWILYNIKMGEDKVKVGIKPDSLKSDITQVLRSDIIQEAMSGSQSSTGLIFAASS